MVTKINTLTQETIIAKRVLFFSNKGHVVYYSKIFMNEINYSYFKVQYF